jgi:hypothetical protein
MRVLAVLLLAAGLGLGVAAPAQRRARKLSATLKLAFTPRGGKTTSVSGKVSLRR